MTNVACRQLNESCTSGAEEFQPDALTRKVLNLDVTFHWIADSSLFWFQRQTRRGDEIVVVSAETGAPILEFSISVLKEMLSKALPAQGADLAVRSLHFEGDRRLILQTAKATFDCALPLSECIVSDAAALTSEKVSPDRHFSIFRVDHNIWLRSLISKTELQITFDGEANFAYGDIDPSYDRQNVMRRANKQDSPLRGVVWSPDSRFVVVLRHDLRQFPERLFVTEYVTTEADFCYPHFKRLPVAGDKMSPDSHLIVFDTKHCSLRTVSITPQALNDLALHYFLEGIVWWDSSRSELFLISANRGGSRFALNAINLETGETREILHETATFNVRLNPFDYAKPNVRVITDSAEVIWYSERSGFGHLYLYDARSGNLIRQITKGEWVVFDLLHVDEAKRLLYFTASARGVECNPYYRSLYRVSADGGEPQLLTPEPSDHQFGNTFFFGAYRFANDGIDPPQAGSSISPSGEYFVDTYSRVDQAPIYLLRRACGELVSELLVCDASELYKHSWRPPERFIAKSADGVTDLYGVITYPRDFDASKKYPVIDSMYPGPQGSFAPRTFADQLGGGSIHHLQTFADAGFIVVTLDGRGTAHRSRAFRDAFLGTEDVFGAVDHVAAIQHLAAARPFMDLDRVGVRGQSFGGYGALRAILLYPDFFKVAVAATGPAGYLQAEGQTNVERFFGVPADSAKARQYYDLISNTRLASRLKGSVFLIYGGVDESVPLKQAFEVFDAFIEADKDIDMLVVPTSSHSVPKDPYVIRRSVQYFVSHLARGEAVQRGHA